MSIFNIFSNLTVLQSADFVVVEITEQVSVLHPGQSAAQKPQKPSFNLP